MNSSTNATKRWWYIMPIVFITYSLAYLDRANFSFRLRGRHYRRPGHHQGDLLPAGGPVLLGYFFFQIPGAIYAERRSVRKLIFICLILWGGCASLTGVVHNIPALAAIRFILGVVEAAVMPAMLIYISNWFTKSERSRANTFLILGNPVTVLWMSVVSGYLIQAFGWRGNVHHRRGAGSDLGLLLVGAGKRQTVAG
ncbi:2-ketogluconate transporter [Klebsiella aerogenes]|nr:2-ketogluconate transporter [Klebsiella aerogenes]